MKKDKRPTLLQGQIQPLQEPVVTIALVKIKLRGKQNTTATTTNSNKKSNNANLSNLGIKPYDFTGFRYGTTTYEVTVPEDTESVEVYATTLDAKATLTGTGKKQLQKGENKVQIVVTAEDGTTKTYTINIIREAVQEEQDEPVNNEEVTEESGKGLASLKINDLTLSPEFATNIYEYTVKYIGEDARLNIETEATDENYEIEVTGNSDLQEGENIITILVSEKNGNNIATYQVTVQKSLVDEEAIAREEAEKKAKKQKLIIGTVISIIALIAIIIFIIKHRNSKKFAREFTRDSFYGGLGRENFNDEDDYEDVPRAFQQNRFQYSEIEMEDDDEEVVFDRMPKDELKAEFLKGYTSTRRDDIDFSPRYGEEKSSQRQGGKHKGKRFK